MWSAPRRPTPCLACPGDDLTWCRPGSAGARQAGAGTPARSPFGQPVQLQWEHHTKHVHPHRASNCPTHRHTGTVRLHHPVCHGRPVLPGGTHFRSRGAPLPCTRKPTPHPPPQPFCTTILVWPGAGCAIAIDPGGSVHRKGARARISGVGVRAPGRQLTTSRGNPLIGVPRPPSPTHLALSLCRFLCRDRRLFLLTPLYIVSMSAIAAYVPRLLIHVFIVMVGSNLCPGGVREPAEIAVPPRRHPVLPCPLGRGSVVVVSPDLRTLLPAVSGPTIKPCHQTRPTNQWFDHCPHAPRGNLPTRRLPQHHHPPSLARARAGSLTNTHVRCLSLSLS